MSSQGPELESTHSTNRSVRAERRARRSQRGASTPLRQVSTGLHGEVSRKYLRRILLGLPPLIPVLQGRPRACISRRTIQEKPEKEGGLLGRGPGAPPGSHTVLGSIRSTVCCVISGKLLSLSGLEVRGLVQRIIASARHGPATPASSSCRWPIGKPKPSWAASQWSCEADGRRSGDAGTHRLLAAPSCLLPAWNHPARS